MESDDDRASDDPDAAGVAGTVIVGVDAPAPPCKVVRPVFSLSFSVENILFSWPAAESFEWGVY